MRPLETAALGAEGKEAKWEEIDDFRNIKTVLPDLY